MLLKKIQLGLIAAAMMLCGSIAFAEDEEDDNDEIAELTQKAEAGDAEAMNNLGVCYSNGEGVEQDKEKALQLFKKSADKNSPNGTFNLATCYYDGDGVKKDLPKAITLLKKAVKLESYQAYSLLGACYLTGNGVKKDVDEGFELTKVAAEKGIPQAQHNLGNCYEKGIGVEKADLEEAKKWYQKAAKSKYESSIQALKRLKSEAKAKEEVEAGDEDDDEDDEKGKSKSGSKFEIKIFTSKKDIPKGYEKIGSTEISHSGASVSISLGKTSDENEKKKESLRDEVLKEARKQGADAVLILKESGNTEKGSISAEFYKK